jgi:hypothetical protein
LVSHPWPEKFIPNCFEKHHIVVCWDSCSLERAQKNNKLFLYFFGRHFECDPVNFTYTLQRLQSSVSKIKISIPMWNQNVQDYLAHSVYSMNIDNVYISIMYLCVGILYKYETHTMNGIFWMNDLCSVLNCLSVHIRIYWT